MDVEARDHVVILGQTVEIPAERAAYNRIRKDFALRANAAAEYEKLYKQDGSIQKVIEMLGEQMHDTLSLGSCTSNLSTPLGSFSSSSSNPFSKIWYVLSYSTNSRDLCFKVIWCLLYLLANFLFSLLNTALSYFGGVGSFRVTRSSSLNRAVESHRTFTHRSTRES
jgi:hypothetical protein